jgi:hypothetical protein
MPLNIDQYQRSINAENLELRRQVLETDMAIEEAQILISLRIHERLGDMMMLLARNY